MPTPVALVTGATSGIGSEIARQLVADGLRVGVSGRSVERGHHIVEELGSRAVFFPADLLSPGAPSALVGAVVDRFGRLDVLVNNAGIDHSGDLLQVTEDEIRTIFETNTFVAMNALIAAAAQMRRQGDGGTIINITSRLASIGVPTMGIYSASKGALLAFTRAAAVDLASDNIRVNAVAPGMTSTPLYEEWLGKHPNAETMTQRVAEAIPLGRVATPEDVAAVVSFLASPRAAYLTGISIPVDGGYLAT